jgi:hypothetical protein
VCLDGKALLQRRETWYNSLASHLMSKDIFRTQLEYLHGLTGGELEDEPLVAKGPRGGVHKYAYWYEGVPDEVEDSYRDGPYLTVLSVGDDPEKLVINGLTWTKREEIVGPQECECPDEGSRNVGRKPCPLCGALPGKEHKYIYIGEPWVETIYERGQHANVIVKRKRLVRKRRSKLKEKLPARGTFRSGFLVPKGRL